MILESKKLYNLYFLTCILYKIRIPCIVFNLKIKANLINITLVWDDSQMMLSKGDRIRD